MTAQSFVDDLLMAVRWWASRMNSSTIPIRDANGMLSTVAFELQHKTSTEGV